VSWPPIADDSRRRVGPVAAGTQRWLRYARANGSVVNPTSANPAVVIARSLPTIRSSRLLTGGRAGRELHPRRGDDGARQTIREYRRHARGFEDL
jgi:hypothetical protein